MFGSRFIGGDARRCSTSGTRWATGSLTLLSNMFTNLNLTDMETCYKVFRREVIQAIVDRGGPLRLRAGGHGEDRRGCRWRVYEVAISYSGRTYDEGKKIGWRDGVRAIFCIVAYSPPGVRFGVRRASPLVARLTGY